jgi:hypothetical protein
MLVDKDCICAANAETLFGFVSTLGAIESQQARFVLA